MRPWPLDGHPRPRGRHVRLRPVGGRGARRLGRRRHQGRARRHRRPAARAAPDRHRSASRATRTRTSSTPTAASAASASTCPCPRAGRCCCELAARADVFLTSFLPGHRQKFGIDVDDIRAVNPTIIYARGSALGPRGLRGGEGRLRHDRLLVPGRHRGQPSPRPTLEGMIGPPGPAYGDTISGTNLAGGIAAALFKRERTGEPSVVDVSLLGSGLWAMGHTHRAVARTCSEPMVQPPPGVHGSPDQSAGPGSTAPRTTATSRFVMLQPTKFWADVCRHIDRPELIDDPRFATAESDRRAHRRGGRDPRARSSPPAPCPSGASASPRSPVRGRRCRTRCRRPRTRRSAPTNTSSQAGELRAGRQPGAVRRAPPRARAGARRSPSTPTRCCSSSASTGTASSSSRPPARLPRACKGSRCRTSLPCPLRSRLGAAKRVVGRVGACASGNETLSLVSHLPSKPRYELTAKRHPPGVVGVAQCVESIQLLRGVAVNRIGGARIALAHNIGGPTAASAATILEGPGAYGC